MLGSNPGSNQNAFSSVPAEPLSPMVPAASPCTRGLQPQPGLTHGRFISLPGHGQSSAREQRQK